jgi:hypothetical protein
VNGFIDHTPLISFIIFFIILSGLRLSPLGTAAAIGLLFQPHMIDDGDCGAIGGLKIARYVRIFLLFNDAV